MIAFGVERLGSFAPGGRSLLGGVMLAAAPGEVFGLLVLLDVAARLVVAPQEEPVGVITGGAGGLFFLWLTARRRHAEA